MGTLHIIFILFIGTLLHMVVKAECPIISMWNNWPEIYSSVRTATGCRAARHAYTKTDPLEMGQNIKIISIHRRYRYYRYL